MNEPSVVFSSSKLPSHAGGKLLELPRQKIGWEWMSFYVTRLQPGEDGNSRTRLSGSLGLGLRYAATQHLSLRLEGRGFVTLMNNDAVFCKSDQSGLICRVHGNGTTFIQGEFLAGVAFAF